MSVTDPTTGQNVSSRSRRLTIFLPALAGGVGRIDVLGDTPVYSGTLSATGDANGILAKITCFASVNSRAGFSGDVQYLRMGDIQSYVNFKFNHITNTRIFIGFSDQTLTTMTGSDSPPGHYFGLWFSDAFDPTNMYAIASDGVHSPPTRIPITTVDSNLHRLFIRLFRDSGAAEVQLQVDDNTMNGIDGIHTLGLVPQTIPLGFIAGMITKDGGAKSLQLGKIQIESV